MTSLVKRCILCHGVVRGLVLVIRDQTLVASVAAQFAVANAMVLGLEGSTHGSHQKGASRCLFLLDALVILDFAVVDHGRSIMVVVVSGNWHR